MPCALPSPSWPVVAELGSKVRVSSGVGAIHFCSLTLTRKSQAVLRSKLIPSCVSHRKCVASLMSYALLIGSPPVPLTPPHGLQGHGRKEGRQ